MKQKAEHFFTKDEKDRIAQTTKQAETRTIGEIVVMVVDRSDNYFDGEIIGGILFASLLSVVVTSLFFNASMWFFIPLGFIFFFPSRLILKKYPPLKIAFLGAKRVEHAVRHRAVGAFHEKGLTRTKGHTGVLFFLSLLERKVWVLADKGIHEKIGQETLNTFASKVSWGIRDGRACDALCEAITGAADLLSQHFPITPDDIDELPNHVITE
jgi:putative membrane protein